MASGSECCALGDTWILHRDVKNAGSGSDSSVEDFPDSVRPPLGVGEDGENGFEQKGTKGTKSPE